MSAFSFGPQFQSRLVWTGRLAERLLLYAAVWFVFTDGILASWIVGLPTVIAAAGVSMLLVGTKDARINLLRLPSFAVFFVWESIRGGLDVAYRAFHPDLLISPGCLRIPPAATHRSGRGLVAATVNLLPGTLTVENKSDHMLIHVLDMSGDNMKDIDALRRRIRSLFRRSVNVNEAN